MNPPPLNADTEALLQGYLEGTLTPGESTRLLATLEAQPELVGVLLDGLRMDVLIREVVAQRAEAKEAATAMQFSSLEASSRSRRGDEADFEVAADVRQRRARGKAVGLRRSASSPRRLRLLWNRPVVLALAASIILLLSLSFWLFGPTMGQPMLADVQGVDVYIQRGTEFVPAAIGMTLQSADILHIGTNASATIAFGAEPTRMIVRHDTELKILPWAKGKRFELRQGRIEGMVARQPKTRPMVWATSHAEATVVGTEFALETATNATRLEVVEGQVKLTSLDSGQTIQLTNSQYAIAAPGRELKTQPLPYGRGTILREYWSNLEGNNVGELTLHTNYPDQPSGHDFVSRLASPTNWGRNSGARFRGYLYPSKTGVYTFWITAKESAQLTLSSDEDPDHAELIASLHQSAAPGDWDKYPWQKSDPIRLQAGRKYYLEVLHKADEQGGDHCSVAWQPPSGKREVIPGEFLSPLKHKPKDQK